MAKNYPRKQTAVIFVVCFLAVLATAAYAFNEKQTDPESQKLNVIAENLTSAVAAPIADNDEWKKQFIDRSSTKGAFKPVIDKSSESVSTEPLTATDILGRNFFTKYVELRQSGLNTDPQAVQNVATQVVNESMAGVATPKVYLPSEIMILNGSGDIQSIKTYAEKLLTTLSNYMPVKNEAEIALIALEKNNMALLKELDPILAGYKSALNSLLATPVPKPLAEYHLNLINGINMQIWNTQALRKVDADPVTALVAVSLEVKSLQMVSEALGSMQTYFTDSGIVFALPSSGSILQSR